MPEVISVPEPGHLLPETGEELSEVKLLADFLSPLSLPPPSPLSPLSQVCPVAVVWLREALKGEAEANIREGDLTPFQVTFQTTSLQVEFGYSEDFCWPKGSTVLVRAPYLTHSFHCCPEDFY